MRPLEEITVSAAGPEQTPLVEVSGEVDLSNAHELEAALVSAARMDRGGIIVSLVSASYFDSQGVRVLLRVAERMATMRQRLIVVAPPGSLPRRILEIAGGDSAFAMYDSLQAAQGAG